MTAGWSPRPPLSCGRDCFLWLSWIVASWSSVARVTRVCAATACTKATLHPANLTRGALSSGMYATCPAGRRSRACAIRRSSWNSYRKRKSTSAEDNPPTSRIRPLSARNTSMSSTHSPPAAISNTSASTFWASVAPVLRRRIASVLSRSSDRPPARRGSSTIGNPARAVRILRDRAIFGLTFRRQQLIAGFIVDFYCPAQRLVLELDGGAHDDPTQRERDLDRSQILRQLSIRVLRVPNGDVHEQALRALLEPYARPERAR